MEVDSNLSEVELRVLIENSKKKTIREIADLLHMTEEEVSATLDAANAKISSSFMRPGREAEAFLPRPKAFRLEKRIGEQQIGTMKVGSQIVEILSKGIYSAPWNSIKELISNSFDADARKVEIQYFPEERKMIVSDDGLGMDYLDFDEHFTFIVRSLKREKGLVSEVFKRPIIGKIGIGFIAVSELCDQVKVTSAKEGSDTYVEALIDFSKIRSNEAKRKEFYEISQFTLVNFKKEDASQHYTKIELLNLKQPFIEILENKLPSDSQVVTFKPKLFEDIMEEISSESISNVKTEMGPYWEFIINLAMVIPVEYLDKGPIIQLDKADIPKAYLADYDRALGIIAERKEALAKYNFKVFFNGLELRKPVSFPNETEIIDGKYGDDFCLFPIEETLEAVDPATNENSKISFKGFFYYQRTRIIPQQLRGMIIRIKNVAIGGPSQDFWGHPYTGDSLYFPQTFGEIYFDSGLEDGMNIDRSTFKTTHHEYAVTRDALHNFLRARVFSTAKKMYASRRSERAANKDDKMVSSRTAAVKARLGEPFEIRETRKSAQEPIQIDRSDKTVTLNSRSEPLEGFNKKDRFLLEDVAIAIEIAAVQAKSISEVKKIFWRVLREITKYRRT